MTGGPPGATAAVLEVLDEPELPDVLDVLDDGPLPPLRADGVVVARAPPAAVEDGGAELLPSETNSAMAAAATSTATTATLRISQRSGRPEPGSATTGGAGATGRAEGSALGATEAGYDTSPPASRTRRTALAMAPRAR